MNEKPPRRPQSDPQQRYRHGTLIWAIVGVGLVVLALAVMPFDLFWSDTIAQNVGENAVLKRAIKLPYHFFARWGFVIVPVVLLVFRDRWHLLIGFGLNMAAGAAAVHLLKFLVGRARPNRGDGPFDFHLFGDPRLGFDSFPSAHAVFATMLAALLGLYFPRWRSVMILLALMVCVARVSQERHFVSDVIAGAGLGLIIVDLTAYWLGARCFRPLVGPLASPKHTRALPGPQGADAPTDVPPLHEREHGC